MGGTGSLSRNQKRAIRALLEARTVEEAAAKAGLGESTIYRYLQTPSFQAALGQAESVAIHNAARRLVQGAGNSLDVLAELMAEADSESVRRLAASDWLSSVLKWAELALLTTRVQELEKLIYDDKP